MSRSMKGISVIQKLGKTLPQHFLTTICNYHLQDLILTVVIYNLPNNESCTQHVQRIQENSVLSITGVIKGTSQSKLYSEF